MRAVPARVCRAPLPRAPARLPGCTRRGQRQIAACTVMGTAPAQRDWRTESCPRRKTVPDLHPYGPYVVKLSPTALHSSICALNFAVLLVQRGAAWVTARHRLRPSSDHAGRALRSLRERPVSQLFASSATSSASRMISTIHATHSTVRRTRCPQLRKYAEHRRFSGAPRNKTFA